MPKIRTNGKTVEVNKTIYKNLSIVCGDNVVIVDAAAVERFIRAVRKVMEPNNG